MSQWNNLALGVVTVETTRPSPTCPPNYKLQVGQLDTYQLCSFADLPWRHFFSWHVLLNIRSFCKNFNILPYAYRRSSPALMILHPGHNLHITICNLHGHFNHQHSQGKIAEDSRYFPFFQKIGLDISCKLSPNCQALFEKTETNFLKCQALVSWKKHTQTF